LLTRKRARSITQPLCSWESCEYEIKTFGVIIIVARQVILNV
jgi:hypothetical protein